MDILKVLSRGAKQPFGKPASGSAFLPTGATALPSASAGSSVNPQLYHDPIAGAKNRKRKRNGSGAAENNSGATGDSDSDSGESDDSNDADDDDLNELDFFGEKKTTSAPKKQSAKAAKKQKRAAARASTDAVLLEEDACRQILRSHRLKLTLLADRRAAVEAATAAAVETAAEAAMATVEKKLLKKTKGGGNEELDEKASKKIGKKIKKAQEEAAVAAAKAAKDEARKQLFPQPLTAFSQLRQTYNLSARLADNLDRLLYRIPTEVQMASLPLQLDPALALCKTTIPGDENAGSDLGGRGVDFMAVAPTGSGKTLSFLVPAINSILKRRADEKYDKDEKDETGKGRPKHDHVLDTIVVAPTRELALQIANEGKKLAVGTGVRVVAMCKDMRVQSSVEGEASEDNEQEADDDSDDDDDEEDSDASGEGDDGAGKKRKARKQVPVTKADVLVTTPLMLLNSLGRDKKGLRATLPTVHTLVLDEADVLLDPLFRDQTLGIWAACTHHNLRATFWSATMASNVEEMVVEQLAQRRESSNGSGRLLVRLVVGLKDTAVPNVTHRLVYTATEQGKLLAMRQLLHPSTSVSVVGGPGDAGNTALRPPFLVFTQTAERATALHDELKYDIPAAAGGADRLGVLHAALSDSARAAVVRRFRAGQVWVLITTDVLARGIDFAGVNGVVNYDVPVSAAAYVHRAGRTGRAGRQGGLSVTLYTKEDIPFVKSVANVIAASEKQAGGKGEKGDGGIQQWLLDALPEVTKADKKRLKTHGMESRRSIGSKEGKDGKDGKDGANGKAAAAKARITSKSSWERRRDNNRRDAIASSKQRKVQQTAGKQSGDEEEEWGGLE